MHQCYSALPVKSMHIYELLSEGGCRWGGEGGGEGGGGA